MGDDTEEARYVLRSIDFSFPLYPFSQKAFDNFDPVKIAKYDQKKVKFSPLSLS